MAFFVIDGMNVCYYGKQHTNDRKDKINRPDLRVLFIILIKLIKQGDNFHCIFDASYTRNFSESSAKIVTQLIQQYPNYFSKVTGGTRADDSVLNLAYHKKGYIISNDRFRNETEKNPHLAWLDEGRLIKGNRMMDIITINTPQLHINDMIQATTEQYKQDFLKHFQENKKQINSSSNNETTSSKPQKQKKSTSQQPSSPAKKQSQTVTPKATEQKNSASPAKAVFSYQPEIMLSTHSTPINNHSENTLSSSPTSDIKTRVELLQIQIIYILEYVLNIKLTKDQHLGIILGIEGQYMDELQIYATNSKDFTIQKLTLNIDWKKHNQLLKEKGKNTTINKKWKNGIMTELTNFALVFSEMIQEERLFAKPFYIFNNNERELCKLLGVNNFTPVLKWINTNTLSEIFYHKDLPELKISYFIAS